MLVTRTDKRIWIAQTRLRLSKAYCANADDTYDVMVDFTVVADRDLS